MRIYLIGAGVIAQTHAIAAEKLSEPVQLRVADVDPSALETFQKKFPEATVYNDVKQMLNSEKPKENDIVVVATPPFAHLEPTLMALKNGRHVLCEKPFALNIKEAEEMTKVAEENNRFLGCCSIRYKGMPHMEKVKEIIHSGRLGEIYHVSFIHKVERSRAGIEYQPESAWFLDASKSGGGILMDWGPYDFETLNDILSPEAIHVQAAWTAKPITEVDHNNRVFNVETHVGATLSYKSQLQDIRVQYERSSCMHGEGIIKVEIEGTKGSLSWQPFDSQKPVYWRFDQDGKPSVKKVETGPRSPFTIFDNPLVHFYNKVTGKDSHATVNQKALTNFRCVTTIYDVAATSRQRMITVK
ncbi:Gfo/Idh/MocA family protein [Virgibacillus siamensis]|uniref:Gfo/Idh/MocA family protein n=1 Tax=Virgibacillus siamensis TaxID=480071 RepID=UPI00098708D6|nr:Gfo/Idh/MocA family oxidoreductase [Virgibacillus siamensis]